MPSMTTSACLTSSSTVATACGSLRLSATLGRPRLSSIVAPPASACPPGRSTRITSAPRSARIMQACGPGPMPAISTTLIPARGPVPCPSTYVMPVIVTALLSRWGGASVRAGLAGRPAKLSLEGGCFQPSTGGLAGRPAKPRPLVVVQLVHDGVTLAARDEPAVDRDGEHEGDHQGDGQAPPEQAGRETRGHGSGDDQDEEVVDDLHRGDRDGVGGQGEPHSFAGRGAVAAYGGEGQQVAEEEGQRDREQDAARVSPAPPGREHHAEHLADGAPGEAVQGGADGSGPGAVHGSDHIPPRGMRQV